MSLRLNSVITVFILSLLLTGQAGAAQVGPVTVHGFISQGYINSDGNDYIGYTRNGSFDFFEAGLNGFVQPFPRTFISAQVLSRNIGEAIMNEEDFVLDYAMLGINLYNSERTSLSFGAGRVKTPYGLFNDARDNPRGRNSVFLPQAFYSEYSRNYSMRTEGFRLELNHHGDFGDLRLEWVYGKSLYNEHDNALEIVARILQVDESQVTSLSYGTDNRSVYRMIYDTPDNRLRLSLSYFKGNSRVAASSAFSSGKAASKFYIPVLSLQYFMDDWTLTAEYTRSRHDDYAYLNILGTAYLDQQLYHNKTIDYYIEAMYHFNSRLSALYRHEVYQVDKDDPTTPLFHHFSHVFGVNYDISRNWMVRAEMQFIDGTSNVAWETLETDRENRWNAFLIQATYWF